MRTNTLCSLHRLCPNVDCVCICKGCLINKRTVRTTQHSAQVIWQMPHGCLDRYPTVSRVCLYHVCRSPVAVGEAVRWSLLEYLYLLRSADLCMPFTLARTHDSHRAIKLDWRGIWKIFPLKLMQLLMGGHCRVRSGIVMENNNSMW